MKRLELFVEGIVLASRWLLVIFYIGLGIALALYALTFGFKLWEFSTHLFTLDDSDSILKMLGLIDAALIASLVVMVIISGYENFVSHIDTEGITDKLSWFGKLDAGSLKIKLASSIVAISSIHLLQRFLEANTVANDKLYVLMAMHLTFVVSALLLTYIDRLAAAKKIDSGH